MKKLLPVIGAMAGVFVWLYDNDFLLNAGGATAPISAWLLRTLHLQNLSYPFFVLAPLLLLAATGCLTGAIVSYLFRRIGISGDDR